MAVAGAGRPRPNLPAIRSILGSQVRAVVVVAAVAAAYHYSLWTLLRQLSLGTLLACLGLVPGVALLAAAVRAGAARGEPDIEDRTVDFIIGIPLLLTALTVMFLVPVRLSTFFWLWRLDLLVLPFFAAGAVSLMFGVRTLWRLRFAIALLLLAWPPPYLWLLAWPLPHLQVPPDRLGWFATITIAALQRLVAAITANHSVPAVHGSLIPVVPRWSRFPPGLPSVDSGASAVLGFLLVGCALVMALRGSRPRRLLWLVAGMLLAWTLNLAWDLPALAAAGWPRPIRMPVVACLAALAMIATLPLFGLRIGSGVSRPRLGARRGTPGLLGAALVVVLVASGLAAVADSTLRSFELVARDLGPPQVTEIDQQDAAVRGWSLARTDSFPWTTRYFGPDSTWIRYTYHRAPGAAGAPAPSPEAPVMMDVVTTSDRSRLVTYGIEASYRFRPNQLLETRSADLGGGVTGHVAVYRERPGHPWVAVLWEWPVETPHGQRSERVVLYVDDPTAPFPTAPALLRPGPVRSALLLLNDSLGSPRGRRASGALERTENFLVDFAHLVVSADARGRGGSGSPGPAGGRSG
jgi:hypothetical protein